MRLLRIPGRVVEARSDVSPRTIPIPQLDVRPQSLLLVLFGDHVVAAGSMVSGASVTALLSSLGVGEAAARATLSRMTRRDLLERHAVGRQAYFGLTEFGRHTVLAGLERSQAGVLVTEWDGVWTFVSFSLPEDASSTRHELRSRLSWAGLGMLRSGLWGGPQRIDVSALLHDVDLERQVHAFTGTPTPPSEGAALVREAFDLDELEERYTAFLQRWSSVRDPALVTEPLAARVALTADWSQTIRQDPRLPLEFLPRGWPAVDAQARFRALASAWRTGADHQARELLDVRFD